MRKALPQCSSAGASQRASDRFDALIGVKIAIGIVIKTGVGIAGKFAIKIADGTGIATGALITAIEITVNTDAHRSEIAVLEWFDKITGETVVATRAR